jgi:hypothetical protein
MSESPDDPASPPAAPLELPGEYAHQPPNPQQTVDLFAGEWASQLPGPLAAVRAGSVPAFEDPRIDWGLARLGGVADQRVLELGPLEGGHSYMLERAGAREVIAIEANPRAFLRCLVVKELLGLERTRFLYGDFLQQLRADTSRFDLCVASGVLYHLRNPVELLDLLARRTDRLIVWTHYYDEKRISRDPNLSRRFTAAIASYYGDVRHTLHRFEYADALAAPTYCGGGAGFSYWLERSDLLAAVRRFGLTDVEIGFEDVEHPNGPSLALTARRPAGGPV